MENAANCEELLQHMRECVGKVMDAICLQGHIFACLNYEKDNPKVNDGDVLGIDRGLKNIVSCSNGYEVSGKTRNRIKRKRAFQRKQLQAKGTRSPKYRLRYLGGREKRFSLNENHVISKEIVRLPYQHFILEKLSKMGKKKHGRRFNRNISNWSYYQLEQSNNLEKQVRELLVKINEMTLSINRGNNGAENLY